MVLSLLPHCAVHEVGLCLVDAAMLQERYGFAVGALPPLGASPDALLQHPPLAPLPRGAGTTWGGVDGDAADGGCGTSLPSSVSLSSMPAAAAGAMERSSATRAKAAPQLQANTPSTSMPTVPESSRASLLQLLEEMDRLDVEEKAAPVLPVLLPELTQQEGGDVQHGSTIGNNRANDGTDTCSTPSPGVQHGLLEVVEVKNTCPFTVKSTRRSNGKMRRVYHVEDRGPRDGVLEMWVPQLQMEMLASNTSSALLVTRSATKGVRVFRMARDDGYIHAMLEVLAFLYATYVQRQRCPGPEPFKEHVGYVGFLQRTRTLAREAKQVLHDAESHRHAPLGDMRLLLD